MSIQIFLNGEPRELPEGTSLRDLILELDLEGKRYAIEIDAEIAPRAEHATRILRDGERVEVVQAIGGG